MSDADLDALFRASPFAWWEWDFATDEVTFNDLKATMLGYPPGDLAGKGYRGFTDLVHPDDFDRTMDAMRTVIAGPESLYQVDYRIRAADGTYHWYMDRGYVLGRNAAGVPLKVRGLVIDLGKEGALSGSSEAVLDVLAHSLLPSDRGLRSVLVLCSHCRRAKQSNGRYVELSPDLVQLVGTTVSHGICPECLNKLYPEYAGKLLAKWVIRR